MKNRSHVQNLKERMAATAQAENVLEIVQTPPTGDPKKSTPSKNSPVIQTPQTTLDSRLHDIILAQGYSTAPIDFDRSNENVPPTKTRKRRLAATRIMTTNPLDEPQRSSCNIEDSEVIHVSDQEHPTKRSRIDPEKTSYPAIPYPKKKYRTSYSLAKSPAAAPINFDEIPKSKPTRTVEPPKRRLLPMRAAKCVGKKKEDK